MSLIVGDSLVGLRILPALLAGATVLVAALVARELGGARAEQLLAAGATAMSAIVLVNGHWLSTTSVDLLVWTLLSWLTVRAVRLGGGPIWLWAGLTAGMGLQNKMLVVFLLAAFVVGLVITGPRRVFRDPWLWLAGGVALLVWLPNLIWQARHDWPQLELSAAIAAGKLGQQPAVVAVRAVPGRPGQPVPAADLGRRTRHSAPLRRPALVPLRRRRLPRSGRPVHDHRRKPYYIAGLYPALLAAGSLPTMRWVRAGSGRLRRVLLGSAFVLSLPNLILMLPLLPERLLGPVIAVNYDVGETVGWPRFVATRRGGVRDTAGGRWSGGDHSQLRGSWRRRALSARSAGVQRPQRLLRLGATAELGPSGGVRRVPAGAG